MPDGIFLIDGERNLRELSEQAYDREDVLQKFIAQFPKILSCVHNADGTVANGVNPWLLVKREAGVPREQGGGAWWSVDHLLIDREGVPTFVEVKRSTDSRIRREVVGQMLDYAANATANWPVDGIQSMFEATCREQEVDSYETLREFLGESEAPETFWQKVKTNLRARKIRMIFVADEIPRELQAVVEFLNEQMDTAEVLAVEVRQYIGHGMSLLAPHLIGRTEEAEQRKTGTVRPVGTWNESKYFETLASRCEPPIVRVARALFSWSKEHGEGGEILWGSGARTGSFSLSVRGHNPFVVYTYGKLEFFLCKYSGAPFDSQQKKQQLVDRLNALPGITGKIGAESNWSNDKLVLPMAALVDEANLTKFLDTMNWICKEIINRV